MKRIIGAALAVVLLGACSSDSESASTTAAAETTEATEATVAETDAPTTEATTAETDPPETDAPTTEAETTDAPTTEAPTTTEEATTTTAAVDFGVGLVWESAVDPSRVNAPTESRPFYEADGIATQIDIVAPTTADANSDCADAARDLARYEGGEVATQCLLIQWRFDVSADLDTEYSGSAQFSTEDIVTAEGVQIPGSGSAFLDAFPGTVDNVLGVFFPHGGPGSTVRWRTMDGAGRSTTHTYIVPPLADLPPLTFDLDD